MITKTARRRITFVLVATQKRKKIQERRLGCSN
jgi:hypothetical protein